MPFPPAVEEPLTLPFTTHSHQRIYGQRKSPLSSSRFTAPQSKLWFSLGHDNIATDDEEEDEEENKRWSDSAEQQQGVHAEEEESETHLSSHGEEDSDALEWSDNGAGDRQGKEDSSNVSTVVVGDIKSDRHIQASPSYSYANQDQEQDGKYDEGEEEEEDEEEEIIESHIDSPVPDSPATANNAPKLTTLKPRKPFSLAQQPNPASQLDVLRHQATQRLASAWQAICDKYEQQVADAHAAGHEFLDDEIDLETFEIVVDHGVLRSQRKSAAFGTLTTAMGQDVRDPEVEERLRRRREQRRARERELGRTTEQKLQQNAVGRRRHHPLMSKDGDEEESNSADSRTTSSNVVIEVSPRPIRHRKEEGVAKKEKHVDHFGSESASDVDGEGDEEDNLVQDTEDDQDKEFSDDDESGQVRNDEEDLSPPFDNLLDSPLPPTRTRWIATQFSEDDFDDLLSSPAAYAKRRPWRMDQAEQPLRRIIAEECMYERRIRRSLSQEQGYVDNSKGEYDGDGHYSQYTSQHSCNDGEDSGSAPGEHRDAESEDDDGEEEKAEEEAVAHGDETGSYHYLDQDDSIPTLADTRPAHYNPPSSSSPSKSTTPRRLDWSRSRSTSFSRSPSSSASPSPSPSTSPFHKGNTSHSPPSYSNMPFAQHQPTAEPFENTAFSGLPLEQRRVRPRTSLSPRHPRADEMFSSLLAPLSITSPVRPSASSSSHLGTHLFLPQHPRATSMETFPAAKAAMTTAAPNTAHLFSTWRGRGQGKDSKAKKSAATLSSRKRSYATAIELDQVDPYDDESWSRWRALSQGQAVHGDGSGGNEGNGDSDIHNTRNGSHRHAGLVTPSAASSPSDAAPSALLTMMGTSAPSSYPTPPLLPPPPPPPPPATEPPVWKKPDGWQKPKVVAAIEQDEVDPYDDESWTRWQAMNRGQ